MVRSRLELAVGEDGVYVFDFDLGVADGVAHGFDAIRALFADAYFFNDASLFADDDLLLGFGELDDSLALREEIGVGDGAIDGATIDKGVLLVESDLLLDGNFDDAAVDAYAACIDGALSNVELFFNNRDRSLGRGHSGEGQGGGAHVVVDIDFVDFGRVGFEDGLYFIGVIGEGLHGEYGTAGGKAIEQTLEVALGHVELGKGLTGGLDGRARRADNGGVGFRDASLEDVLERGLSLILVMEQADEGM